MKINTIIRDNNYQKTCLQILFIWNIALSVLLVITMGVAIAAVNVAQQKPIQIDYEAQAQKQLEQLEVIDIERMD